MSERVLTSIADGVADVVLARPDKRNALDREMFAAIIAAGEAIATDDSVRAVVLSGAGPGFCAGLDVSLFAALAEAGAPPDAADSLRHDAARAVGVWLDLAIPVIAAVHGVAVGGGLQLALGADIRVVAPDARLGLLEVQWGIVPDMGGTQLLPAVVGADRAKDLIFTGRLVDGEEAYRIGLATRLGDDPHADALSLAHEIAARNPDAIRIAKELVDRSWAAALDDGLRAERELTDGIIGSPNQVAAVEANLASRASRPSTST
jgi:enoyl-CoA hydratase/carnithine racemase